MEARFGSANGRNQAPRCRPPCPYPALLRGLCMQALWLAQRLADLYVGPLSMRPT
jgi:hypothetical protein